MYCKSLSLASNQTSRVGKSSVQFVKSTGAFDPAIQVEPIFSISSQFDIVKSVNVNLWRSFRNRISASIAEVFPLLFAPTKMVLFSENSIWQDFSFRKFLISTNAIFIFYLPSWENPTACRGNTHTAFSAIQFPEVYHR